MSDESDAPPDIAPTDASLQQRSVDEIGPEPAMQGADNSDRDSNWTSTTNSSIDDELDHASRNGGEDTVSPEVYDTPERGQELWEQMIGYMNGEKTPEYDAMMPLVIIAHDIGGIIVKDALAQARLNPRKYGTISDGARVLLFYGCPHRASDALDMEQRLSQFMYSHAATGEPASYFPSSAPKHLAETVMAINSAYLLSKQIYRSYTISIFAASDSANIDEIFDDFCGTMGVPFEVRIPGGLNADHDRKQIEGHLDRLGSYPIVEEDRLDTERLLLATASPLQPLRTADTLYHPFAWISENETYQSWLSQRKPQLLYLDGGSATYLASEYVFYNLDNYHTEKKKHVVLRFSFDRYDNRRDDALDMLATFLAQVHGHFPNKLGWFMLKKIELNRAQRTWHYQNLFELFDACHEKDVLGTFSLVLTNFDECEPVSRRAFLNSFQYIRRTEERPWRVIVTSSKPGALTEHLSDWLVLDLNQSVGDSADESSHEVVDLLPRCHLLLAHRPEARFHEERVIEGMQAIAGLDSNVRELVIKRLSIDEQWPMQRSVRYMFGNIDGMCLESVVDKILDNVPDGELGLKALTWTMYAVRPLTHLEFTTASTFRLDEKNADATLFWSEAVKEEFTKLQTSLTGILAFENNEVAISTHPIRELLTAMFKNQSAGPHTWNDRKGNPHSLIARTCLAYLATPSVRQSLAAGYDSSRCEEPGQVEGIHGTGMLEYAVQNWMYHASQAIHEHDLWEDVDAFVKSGVVSHWSRAYWSLANPVTRSQQPFKSLYPLLVGQGLADLAERWRVDNSEVADGLCEACLNGFSQSVTGLLSQHNHSIETLSGVLACAGSYGDEKAWIELIDHIREEYPQFPWEDQGGQIVHASWLGITSVVARLLEFGCHPDTPHKYSELAFPSIPLRRAILGNSIGAARLLLEHGADPKYKGLDDKTGLHFAADYGHPDMVKLLASYGADLNARTTDFFSPTYRACLTGKPKALEALLSLGANPNLKAVADQDKPGWSPLACAVQEQNVDCVRALLEAKANPNTQGPSGTSLWYAVGNGNLDICQLLLQHGASPDSESNPAGILAFAANFSGTEARLNIIKLLIAKGADINAAMQDTTPIAWACWLPSQHQHAIVEHLLQHGADISLAREDGVGPIHISIYKCNVWLLRLLLDQKNVELEPAGCTPPLILAVRSDDHATEMTSILLERGADPNAKCLGGHLALAWAIQSGQTEVVDLLLQYDAMIDPPDELRDFNELEPMEKALDNGNVDIIRSLAEAGADINRRFDDESTLLHRGIDSDGLGAFLEFRPTLDVQNKTGSAPLHFIRGPTPLENIKLLVRAGSNINIRGFFDTTPLIEALRHGRRDAAKYLLSKKADIKLISPYHGGPLHAACNAGLVDFAQDLIDKGADVNLLVPGEAGTPLSSVFRSSVVKDDPARRDECKMSLMDILLGAGADINATNIMLGTVSGLAAWEGGLGDLRALAARGANLVKSDGMGRSPIHFAAARGWKDMVSFILDNGGVATDKDKLGRNLISWVTQSEIAATLDYILQLTGSEFRWMDPAVLGSKAGCRSG
ncbi:hypothetical protein Daus18300_009903 [Diaporthe australafricana]|uniref:Nephrocystin 3-like N-terminal domain-containing protein n=1 Tax=Diaporthe australafricana TaxID=127596 RepID=A0ABR3WCF7_9PEZI